MSRQQQLDFLNQNFLEIFGNQFNAENILRNPQQSEERPWNMPGFYSTSILPESPENMENRHQEMRSRENQNEFGPLDLSIRSISPNASFYPNAEETIEYEYNEHILNEHLEYLESLADSESLPELESLADSESLPDLGDFESDQSESEDDYLPPIFEYWTSILLGPNEE